MVRPRKKPRAVTPRGMGARNSFRGPRKGVRRPPPKGVIRAPGTPAPGMPPGSPPAPAAPQAPGPAPRTAGSEIMRANAELGLGGAKNAYRDSVFRAAMALGDEGIFNQLRSNPEFAGYQFAVDPNSTMASLARQEQEGLKDIDVNRNAGNTFFSGFRLGDRQNYSGEVSRQRSAALGGYNDALAEYASALAAAQSEYNQGLGEADLYDIDYSLQFDPEPGASAAPPKGVKKSKPKPKKKPKKKKKK